MHEYIILEYAFLAEPFEYIHMLRNMVWESNTLHLRMTTLFLNVMVQSIDNINDIRINT